MRKLALLLSAFGLLAFSGVVAHAQEAAGTEKTEKTEKKELRVLAAPDASATVP